jgi:CheY-like chemotaxis protein
MARRALVVDDDPVSRLVLCHILRGLDWTVEQTADTPQATAALDAADFDLVISDFQLPSGTGVDVLHAVEHSAKPAAFVLVTGIIEYSALSAETTARLSGQLTKPVSSQTLRTMLRNLFPPGDG